MSFIFIHSFIHSFIYLFIYLFVYLFICLFIFFQQVQVTKLLRLY